MRRRLLLRRLCLLLLIAALLLTALLLLIGIRVRRSQNLADDVGDLSRVRAAFQVAETLGRRQRLVSPAHLQAALAVPVPA